MKIDNIFFKFLIVISILLLIGLVNRNITEMYQNNENGNENENSNETLPSSLNDADLNRLDLSELEIKNRRERAICNSYNSINCDLKKCTYSQIDKKCKVIDTTLYSNSEVPNEFYRDTIVYVGIEDKNAEEILRLTPFLDYLELFKFYHNNQPSYIFVSEFYGNNTSISFFFRFEEGNFVNDTMPLITTDNWKLYIKRKTIGSTNKYNIQFKFYGIEHEPLLVLVDLEPEKLYFLGMNLIKRKLTIFVINQELINSENNFNVIDGFDFILKDTIIPIQNAPTIVVGQPTSSSTNESVNNNNNKLNNAELLENLDTRTTSIFIGCNLQRNEFFKGHIGKFDVSKNQRTINDLKRLSGHFSEKSISFNELGSGTLIQNDNELSRPKDPRRPGDIELSIILSDNSVGLYWLPPEEGYDSIKTYVIIMLTNDTNTKYIFYDNVNCVKCYKKIGNLDYGKTYHFLVVAVNDQGIGDTKNRDNYITVKPEVPSPLVDQSVNGFSRLPDKVACNPDGTYNIGKTCVKNEAIIADINNNIHDIVMSHLQDRPNYKINPDIKLPTQ